MSKERDDKARSFRDRKFQESDATEKEKQIARLQSWAGYMRGWDDALQSEAVKKKDKLLEDAKEMLIGVSTQQNIPLLKLHRWLEKLAEFEKSKVGK